MKRIIQLTTIALLLLTAGSAWAQTPDFVSDGIYYNITGTSPYTVEVTDSVGGKYLDSANSYSGTVTIPATVSDGTNTYNVTSIGGWTFSSCSDLTEIVLPESLTSIGVYAFSNCNGLTSIDIPKGVTSIGYGIFRYCRNLANITLPDGITSISSYAFDNCSSLTSIRLPDDLTSIGDGAFSGCSGLTSINIPDGVTNIGNRAFNYCTGLTSINIPESVTNVGDFAFYGCSSLTKISIPIGVTSIGHQVFHDCIGLTEITLPKSITSIISGAFSSCSNLTSINIETGNTIYKTVDGILFSVNGDTLYTYPRGKLERSYAVPTEVTTIERFAFSSCSSLTSITLSTSVTNIGGWAFSDCENLTNITLQGTTPPIIGTDPYEGCCDAFSDVPLTAIYVPPGSEETYKTAPVWSNYAHLIKYDPTSSEQINNTALAAYPNPTKDLITVTGLTAGNIIRLYNLSGAQVATYIAPAAEMTIDFSNLSSGMYFLNVEGKTARVIKE